MIEVDPRITKGDIMPETLWWNGEDLVYQCDRDYTLKTTWEEVRAAAEALLEWADRQVEEARDLVAWADAL